MSDTLTCSDIMSALKNAYGKIDNSLFYNRNPFLDLFNYHSDSHIRQMSLFEREMYGYEVDEKTGVVKRT